MIGEHKTTKLVDEEKLARERNRDIETFTQQLSPAVTGGTFKPGYFLQSGVGHTRQYVIYYKHTRADTEKDRLWTL